jgi:hypothetical protein
VHRFITFILIVGLLATVVAGCATVATKQDFSEPQVKKMLDAAQFSGAEFKSPYEFLRARLFYEQALRENADGNTATARRYLGAAYDAARLAYENALKFRIAK